MTTSRSFSRCVLLLALCAFASAIKTKPLPRSQPRKAPTKRTKSVRRDAAPVDSPSGGYAPSKVGCPAGLSVRQVPIQGELDAREAAYLAKHNTATLPAWYTYLKNVDLEDFDVDAFLGSGNGLPVTGASVSGGGLRAMLFGGSVLNGLDARNSTAFDAKTGGALQILTYLTGLSGGSWLVGSYALADAPTFTTLNETVWKLQDPLLAPEADEPFLYEDALKAVQAKRAAGYNASIVDVYGRFLSYHLVNTPNTTYPGIATLWDGILETKSFQNATLPFPIITSVGKSQDAALSLASPMYEQGPYEFGIRHPSLNAFFPTQYVGTNAVNGSVPAGDNCTVGFDNAVFWMATSSNIFGLEYDQDPDSPLFGPESPLGFFLNSSTVQELFPGQVTQDSVSALFPSPFQGLNASHYPSSAQSELEIIDGGSTGELIPFQPLIVPERKLDVILAIDASADTAANYPNGTSPYTTYQRSRLPGGFDFVDFPEMPPPGSAYNNLTWFGCDSNVTIIYIPNGPVGTNDTGTSTFQAQYSAQQTDDFFTNGYDIITQLGAPEWPTCLACALIDKQVARNGGKRTAQCQSCFDQYCYSDASGHSHQAAPATVSGRPVGPSPSSKKRHEQVALTGDQYYCPAGLAACPVGLNGFECIDLQSELESCGACGLNCEELPGLKSGGGVICSSGRCEALECAADWHLEKGVCISNLS